MNIRPANIKDTVKIYELAKINSLNNHKPEKTDHSFLVSNFSFKEYQQYILNNRYFYLIENSAEICGFIMAFMKKEINTNELVNKKILAYSGNDFLIIKQICISPQHHHKGYGTILYRFLMNKVKQNIFAAVVLQPANQVSINFHKKMGFINAFTVTPEDQIKRAVFFYANS